MPRTENDGSSLGGYLNKLSCSDLSCDCGGEKLGAGKALNKPICSVTSVLLDSAALCTVAHQALSMGFSLSQSLCPWDSLGGNTGVGCHFLLQNKRIAWPYSFSQMILWLFL